MGSQFINRSLTKKVKYDPKGDELSPPLLAIVCRITGRKIFFLLLKYNIECRHEANESYGAMNLPLGTFAYIQVRRYSHSDHEPAHSVQSIDRLLSVPDGISVNVKLENRKVPQILLDIEAMVVRCEKTEHGSKKSYQIFEHPLIGKIVDERKSNVVAVGQNGSNEDCLVRLSVEIFRRTRPPFSVYPRVYNSFYRTSAVPVKNTEPVLPPTPPPEPLQIMESEYCSGFICRREKKKVNGFIHRGYAIYLPKYEEDAFYETNDEMSGFVMVKVARDLRDGSFNIMERPRIATAKTQFRNTYGYPELLVECIKRSPRMKDIDDNDLWGCEMGRVADDNGLLSSGLPQYSFGTGSVYAWIRRNPSANSRAKWKVSALLVDPTDSGSVSGGGDASQSYNCYYQRAGLEERLRLEKFATAYQEGQYSDSESIKSDDIYVPNVNGWTHRHGRSYRPGHSCESRVLVDQPHIDDKYRGKNLLQLVSIMMEEPSIKQAVKEWNKDLYYQIVNSIFSLEDSNH